MAPPRGRWWSNFSLDMAWPTMDSKSSSETNLMKKMSGTSSLGLKSQSAMLLSLTQISISWLCSPAVAKSSWWKTTKIETNPSTEVSALKLLKRTNKDTQRHCKDKKLQQQEVNHKKLKSNTNSLLLVVEISLALLRRRLPTSASFLDVRQLLVCLPRLS